MTSRVPAMKARDLVKVLRKLGFDEMRASGSHIFFKHLDGRVTIVPKHGGEDLGRGLLRQILREIKLSPQEFIKYL